MRKTHKQKTKMARKLLSKREVKAGTPKFLGKTWQINKEQIKKSIKTKNDKRTKKNNTA